MELKHGDIKLRVVCKFELPHLLPYTIKFWVAVKINQQHYIFLQISYMANLHLNSSWVCFKSNIWTLTFCWALLIPKVVSFSKDSIFWLHLLVKSNHNFSISATNFQFPSHLISVLLCFVSIISISIVSKISAQATATSWTCSGFYISICSCCYLFWFW